MNKILLKVMLSKNGKSEFIGFTRWNDTEKEWQHKKKDDDKWYMGTLDEFLDDEDLLRVVMIPWYGLTSAVGEPVFDGEILSWNEQDARVATYGGCQGLNVQGHFTPFAAIEPENREYVHRD